MFDWLKNLIGWDSVGTIVKARIKMILGVLGAGVSAVSAYSFLPMVSGAMDWKIMAGIAAYLFVDGVVDELVRRHNATDV